MKRSFFTLFLGLMMFSHFACAQKTDTKPAVETKTPPVETKTYSQMDSDEKLRFVAAKSNEILAVFGRTEGDGINEVINVGSDIEISMLELAKRVIEITGSKSRITHLPPLKEGDMTRRLPDISRMRAILGRELTQLEEGIRLTQRFRQASIT